MTFYLSKTYSLDFYKKYERKKMITTNQLYNIEKNKKPSKIFGKMFEQPSVWMGYTDENTKEFYSGYDKEINTTYYSKFDNSEYNDMDT